jgi:hypothetical protein
LLGAGTNGNALTFNGTSRYLGLTNAVIGQWSRDTNGLPIWGAGAYSVVFWVKGAAQTAKFVFTEANTTNTGPIFILQTGQAAANNSKLDCILRGDPPQGAAYINHPFSASVVFDNTWHHVAWVDNRGKVSLYIDGALDANTANFNYAYQDGSITFNTLAVAALLRTTAAVSFAGSVDELSLWERPLSQAEVNTIRTNSGALWGVGGPNVALPPRPVVFYSVPDPVKNVGDWNIFRTMLMGTRPISGSQWYAAPTNGTPVALVDGTNRTYRVTGLTTNNSGDYYFVTASNNYTAGALVTSATNTLTVLPDAAPDPLSGLVNYWPLDTFGFDGTNVYSPELHFGQNMIMSGFDTNSQITAGAITPGAVQYSNGVYFLAGFPTYGVKLAGSPIYYAVNYSVAMWVNAPFSGQNDRRVFSEGSTLGGNPLFTIGTDNVNPPTSPGATIFIRGDNNNNTEVCTRKSTRSVFDGNWHHLVWTDAGGKGKLYVDGTLDETDYTYTRPSITTPAIPLNITSIGAIARATVSNPYTGTNDEYATWSRVLSWTEIQQIMTNGVPVPSGITPPSIAIQPPNHTNGFFVGDSVTFPVSVNGTLPFAYQWRQNGTNMDAALNPSALGDTLTLTNIQANLSNTTYSVVVTNAAGSVTSSVVKLYVIPYTPATNGTVLSLDFGAAGAPNAQPGFSEMTLTVNPVVVNTIRVTLSLIGVGPMADRLRSAAPWVVNNPPYLTQAQIYNDFIFNNDGGFANGRGLKLLVEHLAPGTNYGVTLWSFDPVSAPDRVSDWTETASASPVTIQTGYSFNGSIQPTNDFEQTLGGLLTASPDGKLQLEGVRNGGTSFGVFVNAIRLVANPAARTRVMRGRVDSVNPGNILVTAVGEWPGQEISIEQTTDLQAGPWVPAVSGTPVSTNGCVVMTSFPIDPSQPQLFYRGKP